MKKCTAIILGTAMVLSLAACGSQGNEESVSDTLPTNNAGGAGSEASSEASSATSEESFQEDQTESVGEASSEMPEESAGGKTLVVYYSATNNTEAVAGYIAEATGGDSFELLPTEPYSNDDLDWTNRDSRVSREYADASLRVVELESTAPDNWEEYDTVFIGYLRSKGVSYIFAGKEKFDCPLLLHKLQTKFGIERLMIAGGGVTNWFFAVEGLVDELSIVIAPVADGGTESVSIFEETGKQPRPPVPFRLKEAKPFEGNGVWLRYLKGR